MNETFIRHFSIIQDPRIDRCKKHQLIDILFLSICAVITGAEGWEDIEDFAHIKIDWLRKYCAFANGIPRHDTIARVISRLNPKEVQSSFVSWINEILEHMDGNVIAIDGKTARGSFTTKERKNALHMVSAWSCGHQLVLGQSRVDQKSNEITAIPKLLDLLELQNNIVTLDAMGCQKEIAAKIVQKKGDYVIGLKGNQEGLQKELEALYHKQEREGLNELNSDEYETIDSGHGRIEKRRCRQMLIDLCWIDKRFRWKGLQTFIIVNAEVHDKSTGKTRQSERWYISSLGLNAKEALKSIRSHWQVESMHWTLDMTFKEDGSRIRRGHGAEMMNVFRKIALNLVKHESSKNASMKRKLKMAALDDNYLSAVISSAIKML